MFKSAYLLESAVCCFTGCVSRVGGMNLSFIKGEVSVACAALVVCKLPNCVVVYADIKMVPLTAPYLPGR
jgi:deoxyinosine 3'endonuclease (endonuclease V)